MVRTFILMWLICCAGAGYAQEKVGASSQPMGTSPSHVPAEIMGPNNKTNGLQADNQLSADIVAGLMNNPGLAGKLKDVQVNVMDGRVILQGKVATEQDRIAVISQVEHTPGVNGVDDQLQLQRK